MCGRYSFFLVIFIFALVSGYVIENGISRDLDDGDDIFDQDLNIERKLSSDGFDSENQLQQRMARQFVNQTNLNPGYGAIENGVGCGYQRMRPGQVVTIQSSNFLVGEYFNNEACVWKFFGHHCALTAQCPCADIPQSKHCIEDYLKISDGFIYLQRFCGDVRPTGEYNSATNNLRIKFRSDHKETAAGFLCYVSCAPPGRATFVIPNNITCPVTEILGGISSSTTLFPLQNTTNPNSVGEVTIAPPQGPPNRIVVQWS